MGGNVGSKKRNADINVVPMIDIVLVLLIIFMVITPLIVKQMDLNIPDKSEEAVKPEDVPKDQVVLIMAADKRVFLNKEEVPMDELESRLKRIYQGRPHAEKILFFDAEDATNYRATVKVLDLARGAGVAKIGLVTERANMLPPDAPTAPGAPDSPPG